MQTKQKKFSLTKRYCEICGKELPFEYPSGKKIPKDKYTTKRFCSYECTNKWKSIDQRIANPRKMDRLYHIWVGMKERCNNPNGKSAKWYYEKGIRVCKEWENDFVAFRKWAIQNGYDYSKTRKEQSLDRIDDSKGYSPDNCRWVTHSENCRNKVNNVLITKNSTTKTATEWAESLGIAPKTILNRAQKSNDPDVLLDTQKRAHQSNTGIKGISLVRGHYHVYMNHKYIGSRKTLEEAKELKNQHVKG